MNTKAENTSVKLVIFDLDGTLLNTLDDLTDAVNHVMTEFAWRTYTTRAIRGFVGNGIKKLMERAVPGGAENDKFAAAFESFKEYYTAHCSLKTAPYDGIDVLLKQLYADGIMAAVVSNKNDEAVKLLCNKYFAGYVKAAVGQRDGIRKKPAPDTVEQVLTQLNCDRQNAVYVGDSEVDAQTAVNAGLKCVLVSWGFRDRELLERQQAVAVIDEPLQLLKQILA